jgi:hypothetical protein
MERYIKRLIRYFICTSERTLCILYLLIYKTGTITGNPKANMKWKNYKADIVQPHLVYIAGWAKDIPFANLSFASNGKPALIWLLKAWKDGTTLWHRLTQSEADERLHELTASYTSGTKAMPALWKGWSD